MQKRRRCPNWEKCRSKEYYRVTTEDWRCPACDSKGDKLIIKRD